LEWNVLYDDFNAKKITTYNIFDHGYFLEDCKFIASKNIEKREEFAEEIRKLLSYYFWSKCEWEIIVSEWPPSKRNVEKKISVYDQIMINWDRFIDYLLNNIEELKK